MKIYKDILTALKISNCSLKFNNTSYFCVPLDISGITWTVALDTDVVLNGTGLISILFNDEYIKFPCNIESVKSDTYSFYSCVHTLTIGITDSSDSAMIFMTNLREVEKDFLKWNKRKEERYDIKENIELIGFDSPEQKIITQQEEELPCLIDNISFSGVKIITYASYFPINKPVCILLSFTAPFEKIPVKAFVRHCIEKQDIKKQTKLAILSLEFEHTPIPLLNRINRMIDKIKNT